MRRSRSTALVLFAVLTSIATTLFAAPVTLSGTITYQGTHAADTLFVAVVDTVGVEDVTILDLQTIAVGAPPLTQPYTLGFDNAGVSATVLIAAFLDVDGGGIDDISGADVFGWYAGGTEPSGVSSASSQSALDFALPLAEIHGTITLVPGQIEARIDVSGDTNCLEEGFRPGHIATSSGSYAIIGVYPGVYCVSAEGSTMSGNLRVCHGDATCANPTLVSLTTTEVRMGVDLDFTQATSVESHAWSRVKALFR